MLGIEVHVARGHDQTAHAGEGWGGGGRDVWARQVGCSQLCGGRVGGEHLCGRGRGPQLGPSCCTARCPAACARQQNPAHVQPSGDRIVATQSPAIVNVTPTAT